MTDKEIIERAKAAENRTGFGELVHSPISRGVNSAYGIGFIEGMVEYRNSLQEKNISKIWHDTNEESNRSSILMLQFENNFHKPVIANPMEGDFPWEKVVKLNHISKWAYIDDLLKVDTIKQEGSVIEDILDISKIDAKVQYANVEGGIHAHAETYSFNIESELFNQLTKEQQALWRKEIEQACISGGYSGLNLAKDPRYKENLEVKEVSYVPMDNDFERDAVNFCFDNGLNTTPRIAKTIAKHFFELGLKAQKGG